MLGLLALALSACQSSHPAPAQQAGREIPKPAPTLAQAISKATDLGPAGSSTIGHLSFGLKVRNPDLLGSLLASGQTISPAAYAADFAPDPALVRRALTTLNAAGLSAGWRAPSSLIAADGPAPVAAALLNVEIDSYRLPDGTLFYAARDQPRLPAVLTPVISNVSGLDDYRRPHVSMDRPCGLIPRPRPSLHNSQAPRRA